MDLPFSQETVPDGETPKARGYREESGAESINIGAIVEKHRGIINGLFADPDRLIRRVSSRLNRGWNACR